MLAGPGRAEPGMHASVRASASDIAVGHVHDTHSQHATGSGFYVTRVCVHQDYQTLYRRISGFD